jgi:hypothetical protein
MTDVTTPEQADDDRSYEPPELSVLGDVGELTSETDSLSEPPK